MKTITILFSEISQHSKFMKKIATISSQIRFYVHQQPMVPDHGTQCEENPSSHHGGMREDG